MKQAVIYAKAEYFNSKDNVQHPSALQHQRIHLKFPHTTDSRCSENKFNVLPNDTIHFQILCYRGQIERRLLESA